MTMTADTPDPATDDDRPVWEPHGHPVRWALGLAMLIAAVSLTSIWFGALSPRVDLDPLGWGNQLGTADEVYVVVEVTNDAFAPVRLVRAGESLPGLELTAVEVGGDHDAVVRGDAAPLDEPVIIGRRETVAIALHYRVTDCELVPDDPPDVPIELRTFLGRTRTSDVEALDVDDEGVPLTWTDSLLASRCPTA